MAILKLRVDSKEVNTDFTDYFKSEYAESRDSEELKQFRRQFYQYQYKLVSRSKTANNDLVEFYHKLATDETTQQFYGVSDCDALQLVKFNLDLYIDLNISKIKAEEIFLATSKDVLNQIKNIYDNYNSSPGYINDFLRNADGSIIPFKELFKRWDKVLLVYDSYEAQEQLNKSKIGREVKFTNTNKRHSIEKVNHYLKYANQLIEAASQGKLFEEACKPMTAGKKRNKPSQ